MKPAASTAFALFAKGFALPLAVIAGLSAAPRSAAAGDAPVAFIRALGEQAISVIRRFDIPLATKAACFDQMVRQDFDVTGICRFVLGPYWRIASPAQQQQFCDGFADRRGGSTASASRNPAAEISSRPAVGSVPTASS